MDYEQNIAFMAASFLKANNVVDKFYHRNIDRTSKQLEESLLKGAKKGKVKLFFEKHVQPFKNSDCVGNGKKNERMFVLKHLNFTTRITVVR